MPSPPTNYPVYWLIGVNDGLGILENLAMHALNKPNTDQRVDGIVSVLWRTLVLNWTVAGTKVFFGMATGNLTLLSDGFHSILDGANNVLGIFAIKVSALPPDQDHPYGHRKFEHVAAMIIGGLVILLSWETLQGVFADLWTGFKGERTMAPEPFPAWYYAVVVACLAVNLLVARYEQAAGKRLGSSLLRADAQHTLADSVVTLLALVSLLASGLAWWIDPLLASAVVIMLLRASWSIIAENIATMTDRQRLDPTEVRRVAEAIAGVEEAHDIRSHGMEGDIHLDLHIVVRPTMLAGDVTTVEDLVVARLKESFPGVSLVHVHHETQMEGINFKGDSA